MPGLLSLWGPQRAGLPPWLRPCLPQPRLSSGNFPWQLPRSGLTLGLVSSCGWIFLFEKYFKQLVGKGWRGGKRIINKVMKGRLSTWLGVASASSMVSGLCQGLGASGDWGWGGDILVALQADEKDSLYPSQALLVPVFSLLPAQVLTMQETNR